ESTQTAWIIHSSGSTGLPKSILQTHSAAIYNYSINSNMCGFTTLPLYHAHGIASLYRSVYCAKPLYLYSARLPLTSPNIVRVMSEHQFEIFYGVPYALKLLAETEDGTQALKHLKAVSFGGSSCPEDLGNELVAKGVHLMSHYGSTETGQLMMSDLATGEWVYLRPLEPVEPYIRFEKQGVDDIYELVVLDGLRSKVAKNRPDRSYATKDLFTPHPTQAGLWKYFSRKDDTIVLVNGEKTNPLPIEHAVRQHLNVTEALVVGAGKSQLGLFIVASPHAVGMTEEQIISSIMPAVNNANRGQEDFGKVMPDMIRVLPAGTKYPQTDKGTIVRAAFLKQIKEKVDELYDTAETKGETNGNALTLSEEQLKEYLREVVKDILQLEDESRLTVDSDFFSLGMDSLQATTARSRILKAVDIGSQKLGFNVVFEYPSIGRLAKKLFILRQDNSVDTASNREVEDDMRALFRKYSTFRPHSAHSHEDHNGMKEISDQFVLLTGATGSLGAHLLALLLQANNIKKVYVLVRAGSIAKAKARVLASLIERKLLHTIPLESRRKIAAFPSDITSEDLRLPKEIYLEILETVTSVIHLAWPVNFNLSLQSFGAAICGAHNLMQLCLDTHRSSPASFQFISSVSSVAFTPGGFIRETVNEDFTYAQNMGYARSKSVTENLCWLVAREYGLSARVLRVGQICGDTRFGVWNPTEAIPLIFHGAVTTGCIPALDDNPRWLPVDVVARTIMDISLLPRVAENGEITPSVFNVVNPNTFHWTKDLLPMIRRAGLQFEALPPREWIARLRASNQDPKVNPPIKLLGFFSGKYDKDTSAEAQSGLKYEVTNTLRSSPALANVSALQGNNIAKCLRYWQETSWPATNIASKIVLVGGTVESAQVEQWKKIDPSVAFVLETKVTEVARLIERSHGGKRMIVLNAPVAYRYRVLYRNVTPAGTRVSMVVYTAERDDVQEHESDVVPIDVFDSVVLEALKMTVLA
ncbi:hypothetical protein V1525DRAFT_351245, partial [Lipomyces kononenkoae]